MNKPTISQETIMTYLASLSLNYVNSGWLNTVEDTKLNQLFAALFEERLDEFHVLIGACKDTPEELIPVLTAFSRIVDILVNDHGSTYDPTQGSLSLRCISRDGVWQQFSKYTGQITHHITIFLDEKAPEGYEQHKDDRLRSARDALSGPVAAEKAWGHLARVCKESLERKFERKEEYPWHLFAIEQYKQASLRETQSYIRENRIFAQVVAREEASRNAVSYSFWRFQNRDKLKRFGL